MYQLFDALVNRFIAKLLGLPAKDTITILPCHMLMKPDEPCDAFKFQDFQEMWAECEANTALRAGLEGIRMKWRETIFAVVATTTVTTEDLESA